MNDFFTLRGSLKFFEIALRLPPLFLMDQILLHDMGLSVFNSTMVPTVDGTNVRVRFVENTSVSMETVQQELNTTESLEMSYLKLYGDPRFSLFPYFISFTTCMSLYFIALFVITLHTRQLAMVYVYFMCFASVPLSYFSHDVMIDTLEKVRGEEHLSTDGEWFFHRYISMTIPAIYNLSLDTRAMLVDYFLQSACAFVLNGVLAFHVRNTVIMRVLPFCLLVPCGLAFMGLPLELLRFSSQIGLILPFVLVCFALLSEGHRVVSAIVVYFKSKQQFIANFGLNTFLETEWIRMRVPSLLRYFWLLRVSQQSLSALLALYGSDTPFDTESITILGRDLLSSGAETIIAVLGMTSVVSTICHYIGAFFHLLLTAEEDDEKSVASVSAVLFFVLALQTGLTGLEPDKRFVRLCKNLCLLLTALFHFIHNMVNPVLMSLSASHSYNSRKHIRALSICAFLVLTPLLLLSYLWQMFSVGTWLLAVSAFCIEVIVKVTVTVSVYLLFLYDQYYREGTWEALDDAVYYVKAVGNSVEFCFAVFLFFNGGWILLFESGGTIRAFMMLIHAYCNIWCEARAGWQTFMKRRTAVAKINSLPDASASELESHNDVCAICYQDMLTAKVTRCRHFFHGVCLRKWLYVQDSCPLCHCTLYASESNNNSSASDDNEDVIDNDADTDDVMDDSDHDEYLGGGGDGPGEMTSDDLIYDSMEDYNEASSSEENIDEDILHYA